MKKINDPKIIIASLMMVILIMNFRTISPESPTSKPSSSFLSIKNPTTYIYEVISFPQPLDPASNYESLGSGINELIYESLVDYKDNSPKELEGELAHSWAVSSDGKKYTFYLRKGVKFHDGVEFNAYIMKYSLDRVVLMNDFYGPGWILQQSIRGAPIIQANYANVTIADANNYFAANGVVVIDEYTLEINLETTYVPFIYTLAYNVGAAVSPKAVIDNRPNDYTTDGDDQYGMVSLEDWFGMEFDPTLLGLTAGYDLKISGVVPGSREDLNNIHDWMAVNGTGTGPYKIVDFQQDHNITLQKHTGWWGSFSPNSPDEVILKTEPDLSNRTFDLKNGDADQVLVTPTDLNEVIDPGVQIIQNPTLSVFFFGMNMNNNLTMVINESLASTYNAFELNRYSWGTEKASPDNPFTSLLFRQAIATVFNYTSYINNVTNGISERMEGMIPNGLLGHHDKLIEDGFIPTCDPLTAKTLFEAVGWQGTINISYNSGHIGREQFCLALKNSIESLNVGITANVIDLSWPQYYEAYQNRRLPIFFLGWAPDYADPDNFVKTFLHSNLGYWGTWMNYTNYNLDGLIEAAAMEQDVTNREEKYHVIEETAAADYPFLYGYQSHKIVAIKDWIKSFNASGSLNPMSCMVNAEYINKGNFTIYIGHPDDLSYDEGMVGNEIIWTTSEDSPNYYRITRNDTEIVWDYWNGRDNITINVDGLSGGVYNYTCFIYSTEGESAKDSVIISVIPAPTTTTTKPTTTVTTEETTTEKTTEESTTTETTTTTSKSTQPTIEPSSGWTGVILLVSAGAMIIIRRIKAKN